MMIYPVHPVSEIIITADVTEAIRVLQAQPVQEAARVYQVLWDHKAHREHLESRDTLEQPALLVLRVQLVRLAPLENREYFVLL